MIELKVWVHICYEQAAKVVQISRIEKRQRSRTFINRSQINVQRKICAHIVPTGGIDQYNVEAIVELFDRNHCCLLYGDALRMPFTEF